MGTFDSLADLLKLLHALDVDIAVLGIVGQIAGEQNKIGPLRQAIDHLHGAFEGSGPERIRRAIEAYVCIAELNKRERGSQFRRLPCPGPRRALRLLQRCARLDAPNRALRCPAMMRQS